MVVLKLAFENEQYTNAGAKIASTAADIFNDAEIIVKVKEPQKVEVDMIRENQIVYTYLHLAAAKELTEGLIKSKSINIAYETVTDDNGRLPLLAPMSACCRKNVCSSWMLIVLRKIKKEEDFY